MISRSSWKSLLNIEGFYRAFSCFCVICCIPTSSNAQVTASSHHALIIAIGSYANAEIAPLLGTKYDVASAKLMAKKLGVPDHAITVLEDAAATEGAIRIALQNLALRTKQGDRVFVYFSGHGTRYMDTVAGGCVEALLTHDSRALTNNNMADLLKPIGAMADKVLVFYDACHSGGVLGASPFKARSVTQGDLPTLRPKFSAPLNSACTVPINIRTRNLTVEVVKKGVLPNDVVHLSSSAHNEASFDDEKSGGLATQFFRDCLMGEAKDLDRSGAVSMEEIKICAQKKLNDRLLSYNNLTAHNFQLTGNSQFVPAWFSTAPQQLTSNSAQTELPSVSALKPVSQDEALAQIYAQRNAKAGVSVVLNKSQLRVGVDFLNFSVTADKGGYVYAALLGSDAKSMYLIFPNELDNNNRIGPKQTLTLPADSWRLRANGPAGKSKLLVIVSDQPRDMSVLESGKTGAFVANLNDANGRAKMGWFLRTPQIAGAGDSFGAALSEFEEVK
jgi:Caspase domain/Domain of unknown function (DUF4384)